MFYWFWPSSFPIKIAWKLKLFLESRNEGNHLLCRVMILIRKEETLWGKQHYKLSFETFVWRACQVTKKCACYRYLITFFLLLGWHQKLGIFCYKCLIIFYGSVLWDIFAFFLLKWLHDRCIVINKTVFCEWKVIKCTAVFENKWHFKLPTTNFELTKFVVIRFKFTFDVWRGRKRYLNSWGATTGQGCSRAWPWEKDAWIRVFLCFCPHY